MSEQELRDRLRAEVDGVQAPPGLLARVERGHRRRRTGQLLAAAVAVVAVVGGIVAVLPDRAPAPLPVAAAPDGCAELPPPAAVAPAPAGTDMSGWGYRGDPGTKAEVTELARDWRELYEPPSYSTPVAVTAALPVAGRRVTAADGDPHLVFAVAVRLASGWRLAVGEAATTPGQPPKMYRGTSVPLPAPEPGAVVSAYVSLTEAVSMEVGPPSTGIVLVLGAPGADRVDWAGCRDGRTVRAGADGGTLIAPVGTVETAGRVDVRAGGRVVSAGRVQDLAAIPLARPAPVTEPYGYRLRALDEVTLLAEHRSEPLDLYQVLPVRAPRRDRALLLGACAGRGEVTVGGVPLPCDGRTHTLREGSSDLATEKPAVLGSPDRATGRTSLVVSIKVVVPVR